MEKKVCKACGLNKPISSFKLYGGRWRAQTCLRCKKGKLPTSDAERFTRPLDSKRYIITTAQNATPVHEALWATLRRAADELEAELVVLPIRYKNPTSQWTQYSRDADWWAEETVPFLFNTRKKLNDNLVLIGDVKTIPTASSPLSGFESLTGKESCILGHTKMQMKMVAVPSGRYPKLLSTTGSCTKPNFTDSKQGAIGKFHHFLGAILVEIDGKTFHLRQLNANREDGSFIDKEWLYTEKGRKHAARAAAVIFGDLHERFSDKKVCEATFGEGGIVETLDPEVQVFHDTVENFAASPHHRGNPFIAQAKFRGSAGNVRNEVMAAVEFVCQHTPDSRKSVLVASNHDDMLARWMCRTDWREDPENAEFYLETALAIVRSAQLGEGGAEYRDAFAHWVEEYRGDAAVRALGKNESFTVQGIECGLHGDDGPNGARGTLKNLSRMGTRVITGHSHTPGIEEGHYQVGTSTPLRLEYNVGPSSWLNTHCVVYANGKRSLINIIDGKWCLPDSR
jgi:hypothetical protein